MRMTLDADADADGPLSEDEGRELNFFLGPEVTSSEEGKVKGLPILMIKFRNYYCIEILRHVILL